MSYVGIDEKFLAGRLRELADKLDADFWGNIISVLDALKLQQSIYNEKLYAVQKNVLTDLMREWYKKEQAKDGSKNELP